MSGVTADLEIGFGSDNGVWGVVGIDDKAVITFIDEIKTSDVNRLFAVVVELEPLVDGFVLIRGWVGENFVKEDGSVDG